MPRRPPWLTPPAWSASATSPSTRRCPRPVSGSNPSAGTHFSPRWPPGSPAAIPRILAPLGTDATPALLDAIRSAGTDPATLPRRDLPTMRNVVRYDDAGGRVWDLVLGEEHFEALSVHPADVSDAALAAPGVLVSAMALHAQLELAAWLRAPHHGDRSTSIRRRTTSPATRPLCWMPSARCDVFLPSEVEAAALAGTSDLARRRRDLPRARPTGGGDQTRRGRMPGRDPAAPRTHRGAQPMSSNRWTAPAQATRSAGLSPPSICAAATRTPRPRPARRAARIAVGAPGIDGLLAAVTAGGAMTRITVINPNTSAELTATITEAAQAVAGAGVTVTGVHPAVGVPSVESHAEEAIAAVGVHRAGPCAPGRHRRIRHRLLRRHRCCRRPRGRHLSGRRDDRGRAADRLPGGAPVRRRSPCLPAPSPTATASSARSGSSTAAP